MNRIIFCLLVFAAALLFAPNYANAQTFKFECLCTDAVTGDTCDVCTPSSNIAGRSFSGLMIYRYNTATTDYDPYKWIDAPYSIRQKPGQSLEFLEYGTTNPDRITISRTQTEFYTYAGFLDSTWCECNNNRVLFYASDSTDFAPIYTGDTLLITGWGATTVTFDSILKKYVIYTPVSGGTGTLTNFSFTDDNGFDGTVTNPTTTPNLTLATTVTGIIYGATGSLNPVTIGSGLTFSAPTLSAVDVSATNELQTYSHSGTTSYTNTLSNSGGSFTLQSGTGIGISHTGGTTTFTNTSPLGTGTVNYFPKWATSSTLSSTSLLYDNGTGVGVGNSGSFLTGGRLEISKSYSNTTDVNAVVTGNIPLIGWRTTTGRFAMGAGYVNPTTLTILGSATAANPTTELINLFADGTEINSNTARFYLNSGIVNAGGAIGHSFGASSAPSGVGFYVSVASGQRLRYQGQGNLTYVDYWSPATGSNRNYSFASGYFSAGDFNLLKSSTAGGTPSDLIFSIDPTGNTGWGTSTPAQFFHVQGTARITGSSGTATTITGRNASGDISNVAIGSGLSLSGGTLSNTVTAGWALGGNTVTSTQTIGTNDNFDFPIETNGTEKARVTTGGSLLVNTTSALARLHAAGVISSVGILSAGGTGLASGTALYRATGTFTSGFGYVFDGDATLSGGNIFGRVRNSSNTANSQAIHNISVAGSTAGDPFTQYQVEGANTWAVGIDNSVAADPFKIARTSALGVSTSDDVFIIETDGRASIGGIATIATTNLTVAGTGGIRIPAGNNAGRPASTESIIRHNTQYDGLESQSSDGGWHLVTARTSPTITAGNAMGTGGTVGATINGSYTSGQIIIQTGTTGLVNNGTIATVNFPIIFSAGPTMLLDGGNPATMNERAKFYVSNQGQTSCIITANGTLTANTNYILWYIIKN